MPTYKISCIFLTAIALQALLFAPAAPSPSPSPSLNNFNIQFNVNNYYRGRNRIDQPSEAPDREPEDDEDVEENIPPPVPAPDMTTDEVVDNVENISVNDDLDEPMGDEGAGVDEEENEEENEEDNEEENEEDNEGESEEDNRPIISDGPTLYELVLDEDRLHSPKVDELVLADTYEDPSREYDIQQMYKEIQTQYFIRRDQLCPVCLAVLERNNGALSIRRELPPRLNQRLIGFFRRLWEHVESVMVFGTNEKIPEALIQSACDWLVPSDIQRRVQSAIQSTRSLINKQSKGKMDPTKAVRKLKAYQRFGETLEESLDDYTCQDDYSYDVAIFKGIFEDRYD